MLARSMPMESSKGGLPIDQLLLMPLTSPQRGLPMA
jgi:hypothetical protein